MVQHSNRDKVRPWIVLAAATGINISMGLNYSWSVIQKALVTDWHWTSLQASLPYAAYAVTLTVAILFSGRLQNRLGARRSIYVGAAFMGAGLISCSFSHHPLLTTVIYSIAGIGAGVCYSTTLPTVIRWFPAEKRGFVAGIVVSGSGLAPIYVSSVANWLLSHYGISQTFLSLGFGVSALLILMSQFFDNPPHGYRPAAPAGSNSGSLSAADSAPTDVSWREMIETPLFCKLWAMYLFVSSAGLMIIGHIATIAKTQTHWENGFYLVLLIALFNTGGRLAAGFFADRYGTMAIMKGVFLLLTIDLLSFATYTTPLLLAVGAAVLGFCYGTCPALFPVVTADFFGTKNLSSNYGVLFTAWGSAALLGPVLAGSVVDLTGTYSIAYALSALFLFAALVLAMTIKPKPIEEAFSYDEE